MSTGTAWAIVGLCALTTALIKGIGPFALGGRELPEWFTHVVKLLPASLLAALVVVGALAEDDQWHAGADTLGVAAAAVVLLRGASVVVGVVVAAGVTAGLRAAGVA